MRRARTPAGRLTSAHLQAAFPFMAEGGLGGRGVYLGRGLYGGAFCYDPWELYARGVLTNPNAIVVGLVGRGKSALVKSYLARQAIFGRQCFVIDPKGEYRTLAEWFGGAWVKLSPGGEVRLNPLDPGLGQEGQLVLLQAVAEASLRRSLRPEEHTACEIALQSATEPTLPRVVDALLRPEEGPAMAVAQSAEEMARAGRDVALELRRLVHGDLAGMFDGPTSDGIDLHAPIVVIDTSAPGMGPEVQAILSTCVAAWLHARMREDQGAKRILVIDEAWTVLAEPATARFLQRSWKLARTFGVQNMLVTHRLSDLSAAGEAGSQQVKIAEGLLSDSETRIILRQHPADLEATRALMGLTDTETSLIERLPRGSALWKVAERSFLVEHHLSRHEEALVDTDQGMR